MLLNILQLQVSPPQRGMIWFQMSTSTKLRHSALHHRIEKRDTCMLLSEFSDGKSEFLRTQNTCP